MTMDDWCREEIAGEEQAEYQIAVLLGVCLDTLVARKKEPDLAEALERALGGKHVLSPVRARSEA